MMIQFICSFLKPTFLSFSQLQIKMVLLFLLTIYAVTGTDLENEDLTKVTEWERKQTQWIKERRCILNLQKPFLTDMLEFESQHIDHEITNANVLKITNRAVLHVLFQFLTLTEFVGMYTINKNFYNFIRRTYSIGGDKKLNRFTYYPMLPTLNVPRDLNMQTKLIKTIEDRHTHYWYPLSTPIESFLDPYEAIVVWQGHLSEVADIMWITIAYEDDAHRLNIDVSTQTGEQPVLDWRSIVVDSVFIPAVVVQDCTSNDSPVGVYRFAWFALSLRDRIKGQAKELHLHQNLSVDVIYQNVDIAGQCFTCILTLTYDPSRKCHTYTGNHVYTFTKGMKWFNRAVLLPEIKDN